VQCNSVHCFSSSMFSASFLRFNEAYTVAWWWKCNNFFQFNGRPKTSAKQRESGCVYQFLSNISEDFTFNAMYYSYSSCWMCRIEQTKFHELISKLQKFITFRLFPDKPEELPPIGKCLWWIPSATKVLALLSEYNTYIQLVLHKYWEHSLAIT